MAKQTQPRPRRPIDARPRPAVEYEASRPDRRPPRHASVTEPRLGPYEFRYTVDFGYTAPRAIA